MVKAMGLAHLLVAGKDCDVAEVCDLSLVPSSFTYYGTA